MASKTNRTYASYYKNDLSINQSSNVGVDATTRNIQDGAGNNTSISISDDVLKVQPITDNTTATFDVKNQSGNSILSVDTTNSRVLAGSSQVNTLTQYAYFSATAMDPLAGYHMIVPFQSSHPYASGHSLTEINMGNGADPATTLDVSAQADASLWSSNYWYIVDPITIESVHILVGGSQASGDALNFHLCKYNLDTSSNPGDLSSEGGSLQMMFDGGSIANANEDTIKVVSLSKNTSNNTASAGQIVLLTVESDSTDEISVNATIKFNIN